jgi:Neprosin
MPLSRYMAKRSPDGRRSAGGTGTRAPEPPDPAGGSFVHCTNGMCAACWGADGVFNVWNPTTETFEDHSIMQLGLQNFDEPQLQAVEAGWIVCQLLNGDGRPHLFTYYTTNGYGSGADNVGGYNLEFDGWVQYDSNIYPGALITWSSTRGGAQAIISIKYQWYEGNWWLQVQGHWLGYYPTSLFMGNQSVFATLGDHADSLGFWGEVGTVVNPEQTTTQMGSGQYAEAGWQQACYQRNLRMHEKRHLMGELLLGRRSRSTRMISRTWHQEPWRSPKARHADPESEDGHATPVDAYNPAESDECAAQSCQLGGRRPVDSWRVDPASTDRREFHRGVSK